MALLLERAVLVLAILSLALVVRPLATYAATRARHVSQDKKVDNRFKEVAPSNWLPVPYLSAGNTDVYPPFTSHDCVGYYAGLSTGYALPVTVSAADLSPWWGPTSNTLGTSTSASVGNSSAPGNASAALADAARKGGKLPPHVELRALWPNTVPRDTWQPLHVYIYDGIDGYSGALADFLDRIDLPAHGIRRRLPAGSTLMWCRTLLV